jgi:predicted DNA-binding transcriptional regulator AlpA
MERVRSNGPLDTVTRRQLAAKLNVSVWTIIRWVKTGQFPPPIRLSETKLVWRVRDIEVWLQLRERASINAPRRATPTWLQE